MATARELQYPNDLAFRNSTSADEANTLPILFYELNNRIAILGCNDYGESVANLFKENFVLGGTVSTVDLFASNGQIFEQQPNFRKIPNCLSGHPKGSADFKTE